MSDMKELGEFLKSERLSRGLSPAAVSKSAGISLAVLQAIEEGNFEWIATPILIRGFIQSYCSALGIDPAPLLEKHAAEIRAYDQQGAGIQKYKSWMDSLGRSRRFGLFHLTALGVALVAIFFGAVWVSDRQARLSVSQHAEKDAYQQQELPSDLSERVSQTAQSAQATGKTEQQSGVNRGPASVSQGASALQAVSGSMSSEGGGAVQGQEPGRPPVEGVGGAAPGEEGQSPAAESKVQKHSFIVESSEKAWIKVNLDGKVAKTASLKPGQQQKWEAERSIRIIMQNVPGLKMTWDGKPLVVPAKAGKVLRFDLPNTRYLPKKHERKKP